MSEHTKIQWCDSTVNWWTGCTKVSPGCANCYAASMAARFPHFGSWGKGAARVRHAGAEKLALKLNRKPWVCDRGCQLSEGLHFGVECGCGSVIHPRRIFHNDMSDWLDTVPVEWLAWMLDGIRRCPDVIHILCTKRPENFFTRLEAINDDAEGTDDGLCEWLGRWYHGAPPANVWLLCSVENQEMFDQRRIPFLDIPAAVHGFSMEPLLGPIDMVPTGAFYDIGWCIVGGESGPKSRPCDVSWIRNIKEQCQSATVPVFVKQLGSLATVQEAAALQYPNLTFDKPNWKLILSDPKGGDPTEWPEDLRVREFPGKFETRL